MNEEFRHSLSGPLYNMYFGSYEENTDIVHIGRSKRDGAKVGSGRYPLGSGKNPNQHEKSSKNNSGAPDWFHKMYTRDKEGTIKLVDKVRSDSQYLKELDSEYNGHLLDYMFENVGNADSWLGVDYGAYKIKEQISKMNDDSEKAIKSKQISRKNIDELLDKQGDVISENGRVKGLKDSSLNERLAKEFENPQYEVIRSVLHGNDLIDFKKSIIPTTITYDDGWNDLRSVLILKNGNKENFDKTVSKVANTMKKEGYVLVDEDPHPKDDTDIYYIYGHDHKNKKLVQVFIGRREIPSIITDPLKQETIETLNKYMIDQNVKHNLSGPLYNMYFGSYEENTDISHVGRSKRDGAKVGSGRYPLGSGKEPYQHTEKKSLVNKIKEKSAESDRLLTKKFNTTMDSLVSNYIIKNSDVDPSFSIKKDKNGSVKVKVGGVVNGEKVSKTIKYDEETKNNNYAKNIIKYCVVNSMKKADSDEERNKIQESYGSYFTKFEKKYYLKNEKRLSKAEKFYMYDIKHANPIRWDIGNDDINRFIKYNNENKNNLTFDQQKHVSKVIRNYQQEEFLQQMMRQQQQQMMHQQMIHQQQMMIRQMH